MYNREKQYYEFGENLNQNLLSKLKKGIWLYFFLLIFEGALRKWIFPGFSEPLLIVRDPVALWLLYTAIKNGVWKPNFSVVLIFGITILSFILAFLVGHGNIQVALYGFRITTIHFPLIFLIGHILNKKDVLLLGKVMLWLTLLMTILVALQFFSPQTAWVNRGIGGDLEGSGFSGAAGYFRVPGTFSFTNGLSFFYGLASAYILYFWLSQEHHISKFLLILATITFLVAIPLTISRTVIFQIAVTIAFTLAIVKGNPAILFRIILIGIFVIMLFTVLNNFYFFRLANIAISERFINANESEGGLEGVFLDRFLGGMYGAFTNENASFWGHGLGMGTNVGAKLMTGDRTFLISEFEWGRLVGEMGFILGFFVVLIRGGVVLQLIKDSWIAIEQKNILPWMLLSFGMILILQGQWAQPTALGFSVLLGGITIASMKEQQLD